MSPRRLELAVDVASALIIVSVAVALAGLTWRIAGDPGRGPRGTAIASGRASAVDVTAILALAPFGRALPTAASPTSLSLELRGVLLAEPRSASTVLIAAGGGPAQSYALGQAVGGGATIEEIGIDRVLLRVGGRSETLGFPNRDARGTASSTPPGPPPAPAAAIIPPAPYPAAAGSPAPVNRAFLDTLGATLTDSGYRIGANPSAATRLAGLLPGDVIEKVNGSVVGDVDRDSRSLDAAFRAGGARIEVLRGGRRITLSLPSR